MSVVFFGSAPFASPSLAAIAKHVTLVVTQPPRPKGRGSEVQPTVIERQAKRLDIPVFAPEKCRGPEVIKRLQAENARLFVVAAYGQILRQSVLDIPSVGPINVHGSVLPKYRGAAPVQHAVLNNEPYSGVTLMHMDAGMDTGDIIATELASIAPDETAGELYDRLAVLGGTLTESWLPRLLSGDYPRQPQNNDEATMAPKVTAADGQITPDMTVSEAYARFRAMTPIPGAWCDIAGGRLKLKTVRPVHLDDEGDPGRVAATRPELIVHLRGGALRLIDVQPPGKRAMSGTDFANGARISPGDVLLSTAELS